MSLAVVSYNCVRQPMTFYKPASVSFNGKFICCWARAPLHQRNTSMALITHLAEYNQAILGNLALQDGKWHSAIADRFLKEGSGRGVIAGSLNREPYQKVVVLTNYATQDIRRGACEIGADAVFDKSIELGALYAYCTEQTENISREEVREAQREAVELLAPATST
jgi:DNA-binding NarL/FixJ family response regulator